MIEIRPKRNRGVKIQEEKKKMKRKLMYLVLILSLSVLTACGGATTEISDIGEELGEVTQIPAEASDEEVTYLLSKVKYSSGDEDEYYYDENGVLLKEMHTYRDSDEKSYAYLLTEYDEKGNPVLEEDVFEFDRYLLVERTEYENTYDAEEKLLSALGKKSTGDNVYIEYEYNENGKVIKESEDRENNGNRYRFRDMIYEYDENDLLIRKRYVFQYSESIDEYNEKGDRISSETRDEQWETYSSSKYKYEYQYDDIGNMIQKSVIL